MQQILELATNITTLISLAALIVLGAFLYAVNRIKSDRELVNNAISKGNTEIVTTLRDVFRVPPEKIPPEQAVDAIRVQLRHRTISNALYFMLSLAVIAAVFLLLRAQLALPNSKVAGLCEGAPTIEVQLMGWNAFRDRNFDSAERAAEKLLRCNDKDYAAYNILGAIAFYRTQYARAVEMFEKTIAVAPRGKPGFELNLADSLVELALQSEDKKRFELLKKALQLYESTGHKGEVSAFKIARARLFSREPKEALNRVKSVSTEYDFEGGKGKARILEGAIHLQIAELFPEQRDASLRMAQEAFEKGAQMDPLYWRGVFLNNQLNPAEPFSGLVAAYGDRARKWIADVR